MSERPQSPENQDPKQSVREVVFGVLRGDFGVLQRNKLINILPNSNDFDASRRNFMATSVAVAGSLALAPNTALALSEETNEANTKAETLMQQIEKDPSILENPRVVDYVIAFVFSDAIYSMAIPKDKDSKVFGRTLPKYGLATNLWAGVKEVLPGETGARQTYKYNKNFPHPNLGALLVLLWWKKDCELKQFKLKHANDNDKHEFHSEVDHSLLETGIGVSMLLAFSSLGKNLEIQDAKALAIEVEKDQKERALAKSSVEDIGEGPEKIPEQISLLQDKMAHLLGGGMLAASLAQIPVLAQGNALFARGKFEATRIIMEDMFMLFEGHNAEAIKAILGQVPNTLVRKKITSLLEGLNSDDVLSKTSLQALLSEAFGESMGDSMMGFADITNSAAGDVGPALVAQLQSFGPEEFSKSLIPLYLYSILSAFKETSWMEHRLGMPANSINLQGNAEAIQYAMKSFANAIYAAGRLAGATVATPFGAAAGMANGSIKNGASQAWSLGGTSRKVFDDAPGFGVSEKMFHDGVNMIQAVFTNPSKASNFHEALHKIETELLQPIAKSSTITGFSSEEEKNASLESAISDLLGHEPSEAEMEVIIDLREHIEKLKNDESELEEEDQGIQELNTLVKDFITAFQNNIGSYSTERENDTQSKMQSVSELLEENPKWANLFSLDFWKEKIKDRKSSPSIRKTLALHTHFDYYEHHVGPELAETAYVVFLQGLGVQSIANSAEDLIFGTDTFQSAPELAKHAGIAFETQEISQFADNWAGALLSASQEFFSVAYPEIMKKFKLNLDSITREDITSGSPKAFGKITKYFRDLEKLLEKELEGNGRSEEIPQVKERIDHYLRIVKYIATLFAVRGGGFTTIGNSPHFIILVNKVAKDITLGRTLSNFVKKFPTQNTARLGLDFVTAVYALPAIEKQISKTF